MPRILIDQGQATKRPLLWHHFQEHGYELVSLPKGGPPPPADLALLDLTGQDSEAILAALDREDWPVDLPVLVLSNRRPKPTHYLTILGWLVAPFEILEIIGAVRATLQARAAMNGQGDLGDVRAQLAATERELGEYESADQKKDEFISYISHELKNPMASIKGYSDLMRRRLAKNPDDPNRKGLEIISAQIGRMTLLLDQLLDFSRISMNRLQLDLRPINLEQLAQRLIEESQPMTDKHALQLVVESQPFAVMGDESRLRQALQYIVGNAIKFSPAPSTIVVTLAQIDDQYAAVTVRDKGIGIPPEDIERIFERFERGSNVDEQMPGMGLGLFLAKEIITRHNGQISAESDLGEGSAFTLTLPVGIT